MTSESLQNFYQDPLNLLCPPRSHNFIEILPIFMLDITFFDLMMIESDGGYGILLESAICNGFD